MKLTLRPGTGNDAVRCGEICFTAFGTISRQHNFPPDIPSVEMATGFLTMLLSRPDIYSVVAEADGKIVGSNFLWEGDIIAGIGPITIDPTVQNGGVGRALMDHALERTAQKNFAGVRLVQAAFHNRSLSLYTKLGFEVREPLATIQGPALKQSIPGFSVRAAAESDLEACNKVCHAIHGHDRKSELRDAIQQKTATVVERSGRITGYTTGIGFFNHAVAESNDDLKALIAAAPEFGRARVPAANAE